jgi:hypothetical protein
VLQQELQGFRAASGLQYAKAGILKGRGRRHADDDFVLHNQDCGLGFGALHAMTSSRRPEGSIFSLNFNYLQNLSPYPARGERQKSRSGHRLDAHLGQRGVALALQDHGNPDSHVSFRNIWIRRLAE